MLRIVTGAAFEGEGAITPGQQMLCCLRKRHFFEEIEF